MPTIALELGEHDRDWDPIEAAASILDGLWKRKEVNDVLKDYGIEDCLEIVKGIITGVIQCTFAITFTRMTTQGLLLFKDLIIIT